MHLTILFRVMNNMIFEIEVISLVSESTSVWIEISFLVITVLETVV